MQLYLVFSGHEQHFNGVCSTETKALEMVAWSKGLCPRRRVWIETVMLDGHYDAMRGAPETQATCEACAGKGWLVTNPAERPERTDRITGELAIERCDSCKRFASDDEAVLHVAELAAGGKRSA